LSSSELKQLASMSYN